MAEIELTKCKKIVDQYMKDFSLLDWQYTVELAGDDSPCVRNECEAMVNYNYEARACTFHINPTADASDIKSTLLHEVLHVCLMDIMEWADRNVNTPQERKILESLTHGTIQRIQNNL